jgi:hypothetical protein
MISYAFVKSDPELRTYIQKADEALGAMGYTEHSFAHVTKCAQEAGDLLEALGYDARTVELARIAGYMHDIGNMVNRSGHAHSGALIAFQLLGKWGMDPAEIAQIVAAIGNHDESTAFPVNPMAAALILADKCDVRRSRVRNQNPAEFDIHDRVNHAVDSAKLVLDRENRNVTLNLTIDTNQCPVMDYFEIFMTRMLLCRRAADCLDLKFRLNINGASIL